MFTAFATSLVFIVVLVLLSKRNQKRRASRRGSFEKSYLRLGFEPPKFKTEHTMRSKGVMEGLETIIDIAVVHDEVAAQIYTHTKLSDVLPPTLRLEAERVSQRYDPGINQSISMIDAQRSSITLQFHQHSWTAPASQVLEVFSPKAAAWLDDFQKSPTLPLTTLKFQEGWLTLGRAITQVGWDRRDITPGEKQEFFVQAIVENLTHFAAQWSFPKEFQENPAQFWLHAFRSSENFEDHRTDALDNLLRGYPDSSAAREAWEHVMERGNLFDLLYTFKTFSKRTLRDIKEDRLIQFMNGIVKQGYSVQSITQLVSARFEFKVLLNRSVRWDLRKALMGLWMSSTNAPNLGVVLAKLPSRLDEKKLLEVLDLVRQTQCLSAAAMLDVAARNQTPTDTGLIAVATAMLELAVVHTEALQQDESFETTLLYLLKFDLPKLSIPVIQALGRVGGTRALATLYELADVGLSISSVPREAKRAHEDIVERLRMNPMMGGMTLAVENEEQGGLSVVQPQGGLEITDSKP